MTAHRIFDHLAQLGEGITLGNDAVPQGRGHITAINLVFLHFKDDLAHGDNLAGCLSRGKTAGGIAADKDFYAQDVIRRVPEWFRVRYSNSQLTLTKYLESWHAISAFFEERRIKRAEQVRREGIISFVEW